MPLVPDTSAMRASAQRLISEANHLRNLAVSVRAIVAQVRWRGAAARAFQDQAGGVCASLSGAAEGLVAAARALRAHAANVDAAIAELTAVFADAADLLDPFGVAHHGGLLGGSPLVEAVDAVRAVERVLPW